MKFVFATNNQHKITEVQQLLSQKYNIISMAELGCTDDIPENEPTLEGNALAKAQYIWEKFKIPCFADDTGLEVEALNGSPGVYSARYAGENKSFEDNITKLLKELNGVNNRKARFRCVIALITLDGKQHFFEGIVNGEILTAKTGIGGFGYDPVFRPDGYDTSFAQMSMEDKNIISHRGIAVRKLAEFLNHL